MKFTNNPFVSALALSLVVVSSSHAGTIWDGGATGGSPDNINNATNWDGNANPTDLTGGTLVVTFGSATSGGTGTATINTNVNFLGIILNRDGNFLIEDGAGNLTVGASGITVSLQNTTSRTHTISESNLILGATQTWSVTNNGAGVARLNVSSLISDLGFGRGITKTGSGILQLSGANSYTGTTDVQAGTLELGASNVFADLSALKISGGILDTTASNWTDTVSTFEMTSGSLNGGGTITAGTYSLSGGTVNANLAVGTMNVTTGTVNLIGASGSLAVNINSGTLSLGANDRLANTATVLVAGGILDTTASNRTDTVGAFNMSSGSLNGGGTITATTYGLSGGAVNANLGAGAMTVTGSTALNGTAAATTVNISAGTLTLGSSNRLANGATVSVSSTGTLNMNGFTDSIGSLSFSGSSATLKMAANQTGSAQLAATGAVAFGSGNTLDLTGMDTTAGIYKLVSGSSLTGAFGTITGLNSNYLLRNGTVTANQLDAQRKADQTLTLTTPASTPRALVSTNVSLSGTLTNTSPSGSSALAVALTSTGTLSVGSLASSTGATVLVGTPSTITGSIATGGSTGTFGWNVRNTDANAIISPVDISGTINVVNQRTFSGPATVDFGRVLLGTALNSGTVNVTTSGLNAVTANSTLGTSTSGTINGLSMTGSATLADGSSSPFNIGRTVSGNLSGAPGTLTGTFNMNATDEFSNVITNAASVSYTVNGVNQRSFSVGTPSFALGRFLIGATPAGTSAISSSGLNATTANASLGGFSTVNGLTLTTGDSTTFNGAASQTANYSVGGTATAGAISGSFSSTVTAELGSISNVNVGVTGTALNQRSFSVGTPTIALGRFLIGATPAGTSAISSSGLNAVTANASLGGFSTVSGLTLTTGDSTTFNGGAASQTANYSVGGTATAGAISGTFSSAVTAELGSISNVNVAVTGTALATRTVNAPTTTALGTFHAGAAVSVTSNAFGYTYGAGGTGANSNTENTTVQAYGGAADANGITLSGGLNSISSASTFTRSFTGTATVSSSSGSFSSTVNPEFSSATSVSAGYTIGVYSGQMAWSGGSGTYATGSNWTDSVAGGAQNAPGLDAGFTGVDTATFTGSGGTVALGGSNPSLNAMTFANANGYTITTTGGSITMAGATPTITTTAGTHQISASIAGSNGLKKNGGGTLALSAANTFTGATIIQAGTLQLLSGGSLASLNLVVGDTGSVGAALDAIATGLVVASGQTVSGIGTIQGNTTIQSAGAIAPGNSSGILTNLGNMTLAVGSDFQAEINGTAAGTGYDQLNVTGVVSLAGLLSVTTGFTPTVGDLFFLIDNDGPSAIGGGFSNAPINGNTYTFGSQQYAISYFGDYTGNVLTNSFTGGNDVVLMAVPEPGAALLGGIGLLCLLRRRRG